MSNENEKTDAEQRFANLELDGPLTKGGAEVVTCADVVPGDVVTVGEVVPERAAIADAEVADAASHFGFAVDRLKPTWFESGTKMMDMGEAIAMADRKEWEHRPTVNVAMENFIEVIDAENRQDINIPIRELSLDDVGIIRRRANGNGHTHQGGLLLNEVAWRQLAQMAPYEIPPVLRNNLALWLGKSERVARFRIRNAELGIAECHAVVGKEFPKVDADDIARMVIERMPEDAKGEVHYDGKKCSIEVSFHNPYEVDELAVGRLHRIAGQLRFADNGTHSLQWRWKMQRIQCVNCTIVADSEFVFSIPHKSNLDVYTLLDKALASQGGVLDSFANRWRDAYAKSYGDYDGTTFGAEEAFKRLIVNGMVNVPGFSRKKGWQDELLVQLMDAWNKEPGDTVAHVNQAVTRMAHEQAQTWKSRWVTDELEEQAGALLYARTYLLPAIANEQREQLSW